MNNAQSSQDAQFQTNIGDLQSKFQVADSVMNSAVQLMTSAISLGTQGATGTLTDANRQSIAAQVAGLQQQMLSLANTSYQGTYIFSGTNVTAQPFAQDSSSPSGVTYNGNSAVTTVQISQGQSLQTNLSGDQVFANSSGNAFAALNDLANALNSGTGIAAANTEVQNAFNSLNKQREFYGNGLNQLQSAESFLSQDTLNLSQQQNNLIGADLTQADLEPLAGADCRTGVDQRHRANPQHAHIARLHSNREMFWQVRYRRDVWAFSEVIQASLGASSSPFIPRKANRPTELFGETRRGEKFFDRLSRRSSHSCGEFAVFQELCRAAAQLHGIIRQEATHPIYDRRCWVDIAEYRQSRGHCLKCGHVVPVLKLWIGGMNIESVMAQNIL